VEEGRALAECRYDAADRLLEIRYSEKEAEQFSYDVGDRVTRYSNPACEVWQYEYDPRGFLKKETFPNGEENEFYYDVEGRLISAFNSFWHDVFEYDSRGRIVQVGRLTPVSKGPETLLTYQYDDASRVQSVLFGSRMHCTHEYNQAGDMETLRFLDTRIVIQYDRNGRCQSVHFPGGMKAEFGYSETGGLSRVAVKNSKDETVVSQFCQYQNGRLTKVLSKAPERTGQYTFSYTADGRLGKVLFNDQPVESSDEKGWKESCDAFGRLRAIGRGKDLMEYIYGPGGVVVVRTPASELCIVRSSDGQARAVVRGERVQFPVPAAVPGETFLVEAKSLDIRPLGFRDMSSLIFEIMEGRQK